MMHAALDSDFLYEPLYSGKRRSLSYKDLIDRQVILMIE
jgi:hypothetical protein